MPRVKAARSEAPDKLLTADEAATHLRVTRRTLYAWLKSGKLKGRMIGGLWRIKRSSLTF